MRRAGSRRWVLAVPAVVALGLGLLVYAGEARSADTPAPDDPGRPACPGLMVSMHADFLPADDSGPQTAADALDGFLAANLAHLRGRFSAEAETPTNARFALKENTTRRAVAFMVKAGDSWLVSDFAACDDLTTPPGPPNPSPSPEPSPSPSAPADAS